MSSPSTPIGLVTAAANGTGTVRASHEQLSATAQVTVRQVVAAIAVSPALDSLFAIGDTVTFTAEATDANGYEVVDAVVAWESSAAPGRDGERKWPRDRGGGR